MAQQAAATDKKDQWIFDLYQKANAAADDTDKQIAALYIADYKKRQRD
ncbi:MAG: hypothetical protein WDN29_11755 [Methylovirgula sp.]